MTSSFLWLIAAIAVVLVSAGLVLLHWKTYSLPIRLLPVDILTVVLLIDLNIKSSSNVTLADPLMKIEAIAFTGLLAFILFAPVLWKLAFDRESAPLTQPDHDIDILRLDLSHNQFSTTA